MVTTWSSPQAPLAAGFAPSQSPTDHSSESGRYGSTVSHDLSLPGESRGYWIVNPNFYWAVLVPCRDQASRVPRSTWDRSELSAGRTQKLPLTAPFSLSTFAMPDPMTAVGHCFRHRLSPDLPSSPLGHCRWFDSPRSWLCRFGDSHQNCFTFPRINCGVATRKDVFRYCCRQQQRSHRRHRLPAHCWDPTACGGFREFSPYHFGKHLLDAPVA